MNFLAVFDECLMIMLMARIKHPRDLVNFGTVCRTTRKFLVQYIGETQIPFLARLIQQPDSINMVSAFLKLSRGATVTHPTPFPEIKKMTDMWFSHKNRIDIYQSFHHTAKAFTEMYIVKAPPSIEGRFHHEVVHGRQPGPHAFGVEHYYHNRIPFGKSVLLKRSDWIEITSNCILPKPGTYDCYIQFYIFTDTELTHFDVDLSGSNSVTTKLLVPVINFPRDEKDRIVPGVVNVKVGSITSAVSCAHAITRLTNVIPVAKCRIAFDFIRYVLVSDNELIGTITKKRKFVELQ